MVVGSFRKITDLLNKYEINSRAYLANSLVLGVELSRLASILNLVKIICEHFITTFLYTYIISVGSNRYI